MLNHPASTKKKVEEAAMSDVMLMDGPFVGLTV